MEKTLEQIPSSCLRIVLFGPESTGKTTLAKALAEYYKTEWVPEFMRTFLQKKWNEHQEICSKDDLLPIAKGQMKAENDALKEANAVLFCDTNLLELKVYSEYYFDGFCPLQIKKQIEQNSYDYYLLTYIDTPWEEDDLRDRPYDRSTLFRIFEAELREQEFPFTILKGNLDERMRSAISIVDGLLEKRNAE